MSCNHPDIPRMFWHVHRQWSELVLSERDAYKRRLAACLDYGTLALFEQWEAWYTEASSPWRWQREGVR